MSDTRLTEARKAHARGWALTPVRGMTPVLPGWVDSPRPTLQEVEKMALTGNLNLAVRTGRISGVVAVELVAGLAPEMNFPTTPSMKDDLGNRVFLFRAPAFDLESSVGEVADGVNYTGKGGLVLLPGSSHPTNPNEVIRWHESPDQVPIADLPRPILEKICPDEPTTSEIAARHLIAMAGIVVCLNQLRDIPLASRPVDILESFIEAGRSLCNDLEDLDSVSYKDAADHIRRQIAAVERERTNP